MTAIEKLYNDPIFLKACSKLSQEDIQFFKDLQSWKVDLKNKKDLKKRWKNIQLKMVADFNWQEIRRFIKIMELIAIYYNNLHNRDVVQNKA